MEKHKNHKWHKKFRFTSFFLENLILISYFLVILKEKSQSELIFSRIQHTQKKSTKTRAPDGLRAKVRRHEESEREAVRATSGGSGSLVLPWQRSNYLYPRIMKELLSRPTSHHRWTEVFFTFHSFTTRKNALGGSSIFILTPV